MYLYIHLQLYIEMHYNYTTSKASNFLYVECETKGWQNGLKHSSLLLGSLCDFELANLNKTCSDFALLLKSHCFQRLAKT